MTNDNIHEQLDARLTTWFNRKTIASALRRVGDLPISIGSDIGNGVRKENQDRVAVMRVPINNDHYFIAVALCDGMGGMAEGSMCASQAVATFFSGCIRNKNLPISDRISKASREANQAVYSKYKAKGGATLSALIYDSINGMAGINVGDSRIYSFNGDTMLEQISTDDTMAGIMKKNVSDSIHGNELLQYIGMGEGMEPHVLSLPINQELIVLTSDGVHFINQQTMESIICFANDPANTTKRLIEVAKWCGGHDNASAAVVKPNAIPARLFDGQDFIQIWDSFGELTVIIPSNENTFNSRIGARSTLLSDDQDSIPNNRKPSKPKAPKSDKKKKAVDPQLERDTNETERPQLKISFIPTPGEDDNA